MIIRRTGFHSITVEIPASELPPPPNAVERLRDCLEVAARWAPDVGADIAETISELILITKGRAA